MGDVACGLQIIQALGDNSLLVTEGPMLITSSANSDL